MLGELELPERTYCDGFNLFDFRFGRILFRDSQALKERRTGADIRPRLVVLVGKGLASRNRKSKGLREKVREEEHAGGLSIIAGSLPNLIRLIASPLPILTVARIDAFGCASPSSPPSRAILQPAISGFLHHPSHSVSVRSFSLVRYFSLQQQAVPSAFVCFPPPRFFLVPCSLCRRW